MNERGKRFLAALRSRNRDERIAILNDLPSAVSTDVAAHFLGGDNPAEQVLALNMLVTSLAFGQAADLAADLAQASYTFARGVYEREGPRGPLQFFTVSAIASSGLHALNLAGRYSDSAKFAGEVIPDLESLPEDVNLPDIYAHRIEALIGLNQIDDAWSLLVRAQELPKRSVHLKRLRDTLEALKRAPTELPLQENSARAGMTLEEFEALDASLGRAEAILTRSSGEMNEFKAAATLRQAGRLFLDKAKGRDPALLAKALADLGPVEAWAHLRGHGDVQNDALWSMYLCHSRLGAFSEAADALQGLRRNLEKRRAGIANPLERAGVVTKYPYVYPALCQMLRKANRVPELLGAIEGAKGRAVADVMAQRAHEVIDEADFATPGAHMAELMRRNGAHYLTFLVDEDDTLAVLVAKDGSLHASGLIPLGRETVRIASRNVDPRTWGQAALSDPLGPPVEGIDRLLRPLVAWLEPLVCSGVMEVGDHLCYSPDEHLHQIPLAYVEFMGERLCRTFSISRTHGARALALILKRAPSRPGAFVSVEVPGRQDLRDEAMVRQLRLPGNWLSEHLPGVSHRDEEATFAAISRSKLSGRVLHFATHGVFPDEEGPSPQNPFEHSGVALAGPKGLPDIERLARGENGQTLLTPERAIAARLDLTGSHVTFQACLTGLAREGIGGDALGLDWACFQLGASSLLASHWNVSAELSSEFFERFYRSWLEKGNSRAAAWREAVLGMMGAEGALADPYAWAAFSLSGDWRGGDE